MRLVLELSLLVISILTPSFLLLAVGNTDEPGSNWPLTTFLASTLIAFAWLIRIHRLYITSLSRLMEKLYGDATRLISDKAHPDIKRLEKAIRFHTTRRNRLGRAEKAKLRARLNKLQGRLRRECAALVDESLRLEASANDIRAEMEHLRAVNQLAAPALQALISAYHPTTGEERAMVAAASRIESLMLNPADGENIDACLLFDIFDDTLAVLSPMPQAAHCRVHLLIETGCPRYVDIDRPGFMHTLFHLILSHLKSGQPGDVSIRVSFLNAKLQLLFSENFSPTTTALPGQQGASWSNRRLLFPATVSGESLQPPPANSLTALVVTDNKEERISLSQRLHTLGVTCISNFKSGQPDICLVADENSISFLAIKSSLPDTTYILSLRGQELRDGPWRVRMDEPITQQGLTEIIESIAYARDEHDSRQVLVVDDSQPNMRLLEIQLRDLGHKVMRADSGAEAVRQVRNNTFEMIFMDLQMPEMDGMEATRKIRELGCTTPVIGLTAHATDQEREACHAAGMSEVLIKPVRTNGLKSIIRRRGRALRRPPRPAPASRPLPVFDRELSLGNANQNPALASELFTLLNDCLPEDQDSINSAAGNKPALKQAVHKLHGAIRYCGTPRLGKAIEKLETALKQDNDDQVPLLLNLLNGEINALLAWARDNPNPSFRVRARGIIIFSTRRRQRRVRNHVHPTG